MKSYNLDELKQQVKHVLEYSQDISNVSEAALDNMMNEWERNKARFINDFMGGKRSFHLGETAKHKKYNEFLDFVALRMNNYELCRFIETQGEEAFYENSVKTGWDHTKSGTFISPGSKLIRAFKYFIEDKELFNSVIEEFMAEWEGQR